MTGITWFFLACANLVVMKNWMLLLVTFILSCSPPSGDKCGTLECQHQQRYDSVIAIHDEVMPKLSTIMSLQKEIDQEIEALADSNQIAELEKLKLDLKTADEAMWVWMRQFKPKMDTVVTQEGMDYLYNQKRKASEMAEKINNSIAAAEKALSE